MDEHSGITAANPDLAQLTPGASHWNRGGKNPILGALLWGSSGEQLPLALFPGQADTPRAAPRGAEGWVLRGIAPRPARMWIGTGFPAWDGHTPLPNRRAIAGAAARQFQALLHFPSVVFEQI